MKIIDMPVLIQNNKAFTNVFTLLTLYFEETTVDYKYSCEKCDKTLFKKKMSISYYPYILILRIIA